MSEVTSQNEKPDILLGSPKSEWREIIKKFKAISHLSSEKWFTAGMSFFIHPKGYPEPFFIHTSEKFLGLPPGFIIIYGWNGDALFRLLGNGMPNAFTRSYEIPFVYCAMRKAEELTEHERSLLAEAGEAVDGAEELPVFVSFRPGWLPWHLSKDEVKASAVVLNQMLGVLIRTEDDSSILYRQNPNSVWGRRQKDDSNWEEGWAMLKPFSEPAKNCKLGSADSALKKALSLPDDMPPLEIAEGIIPKIALMNPEGVKERGEDGRIPLGYFFAISPYGSKDIKESENGVIYLGDNIASLGTSITKILTDYFLKKGHRPKEIAVSSERMMEILRHLQKELPFKIVFHEKLEAFQRVYTAINNIVAKKKSQ